jgi:hypothetical protein
VAGLPPTHLCHGHDGGAPALSLLTPCSLAALAPPAQARAVRPLDAPETTEYTLLAQLPSQLPSIQGLQGSNKQPATL